MTRQKTLIWDLDGTLLDSYPVILSSLLTVYEEQGLQLDRDEVYSYIIHHSVAAYAEKVKAETGIDFQSMLKRYSEISGSRKMEIRPFPDARQTLDALSAMGVVHHVFTHRGETTEPVLKNTGLWDCFGEIITSQSPFGRKPAPDALLYLIRKYGLSPEDTFYVGDRVIDMNCAKNAGIPGVLVMMKGSRCIPDGSESYIVESLSEIPLLSAFRES